MAKINKDKKTFKCLICYKMFSNKKVLEDHKKTHKDVYSCNLCSYTTNTKKYLSRHRKLRHESPTEHECEYCGKKFHFKSKMMDHRRTHTGEKPHQCNECGKSFNAKYSLNGHMLIHENIKPFKCRTCSYACRDSSTLRKHEAYHTGLRPLYRCKQCDKSFRQKWRLKLHVADVHLSLDVRKYSCEMCEAKFKDKAVLRTHIRTVHEKSTACKCEICGKVKTNKSNLWRHMAIHVALRPYKCNKLNCDKAFKDPSSLRKHSKIHLNLPKKPKKVRNVVKKVECDYCGVRFLSKNYLSNHILRKHLRKTQKFYCDMCKFVTRNKPSLVMHIKYGHVSESDRKCKICKTKYKRHMYLKAHYARTHGIRYKTKQRVKQVEIKEEPEDAESIDLFEIEKHEIFDELNFEEVDANQVMSTEAPETTTNDAVPESVVEEFCEKNLVLNEDRDKFNKEQKPRTGVRNKIAKENVRKCIKKLLVEVRKKEDAIAVEKAREMYNDRMKKVTSSVPEQEQINIKYFNNNRLERSRDKVNNDSNKLDDTDKGDEANNDATKQMGDNEETQEINDKTTGGKLKINGHQCYICFKLFETKDKLIEHCKNHFDVCHDVSLKKCPVCQFVTKKDIVKHLRVEHGIKIKLPTKININDKLDKNEDSKYYFKINNPVVNKIEVIPSIRNLNKIASTKIDKKNRERKNKTVAKTKLIKKSGEWIVIDENINVNAEDLLLPNINVDKFKGSEDYLVKMRNLYHAAKKCGKKILFPCEKCDKICQTLAALKLHSRKHDPNAKPFKPKIWKHKTKDAPVNSVKPKQNTDNRLAKPKPIVNNHKCDTELMEFYTKNIRGGDIEFWQFLKIYNRMGREKVQNFEDLESRTDFGIHFNTETTEDPENEIEKTTKVIKRKVIKNKDAFKRVVRISRAEYLKRQAIKDDLRKKVAEGRQ